MTNLGGVRPAPNRPAAKDTVSPADDKLIQAAGRILARHHHPEWRLEGDDLDAWAHGYAAGHRQGYADGSAQ